MTDFIFGALVGALVVLGLWYVLTRVAIAISRRRIRRDVVRSGVPQLVPSGDCPHPCGAVELCIFPLHCEAPTPASQLASRGRAS